MFQSKEKETVVNGQRATARTSSPPDPEVQPVGGRRRYSQEYKLRILAEAAECKHGELGGLLRREGLYYATLSKLRQQQAAGKLDGKTGQQRSEAKEQAGELRRLERENARLAAQLAKAEAVIEVQKKLSMLLAIVDAQDERSPNR